MKRILFLAIVVVAVMAVSYLYQFNALQPVQAQSSMEDEIIKRLDGVLEKENRILQRLDEVEQQVKSRCK